MDCGFRLVMELLGATGERLGQMPLEPDWEPATEWTRLAGLRTLGVWAPEAEAERGVEPLWHSTLGEPYVGGFRVHLGRGDGCAWFADFPLAYFAREARAASADLVHQGRLKAGEEFLYLATAFARPAAVEARVSRFDAVDAPAPLAVLDTPLEPLLAASRLHGEGRAEDFPVFIHQSVLNDARSLTEHAGDRETGGVLIGHLRQANDVNDADAAREIFVEVTALVPARHTVSDSLTLTFTSDTWTDVRAALVLRDRREQLLGWFHSHPQAAWCRAKKCSLEQQRTCSLAAGFLSEQDCTLHRTMFPRAFTLALVMTHTIAGCVPALFGWRTGMLAARPFRVLAARGASPPAFGRQFDGRRRQPTSIAACGSGS
jgi:proteasome lid subunit RPN8/RPN11